MKRWFELVRLEKVSEVRAETWDGFTFSKETTIIISQSPTNRLS